MDSIFLTPDVTIPVTIKPTKNAQGVATFEIIDGGPYLLRTATGREYGKIQQAVGRGDIDSAYSLLPSFLVGGIEAKDMERLRPDLVWFILVEVLNRSRVTEEQAGK